MSPYSGDVDVFRMKAVSGTILVRRRANARLLESGKSLSIFETAIESWKRPTVVVGASSSGESRLRML